MVRHQVVELLGQTHDPGEQRNALPLQTIGIAGAVVPFVVVRNDLAHFGRQVQGVNHPRADLGMVLRHLLLPYIQLAGLGEGPVVLSRNFPDVMQKCPECERAPLRLAQVQTLAQQV